MPTRVKSHLAHRGRKTYRVKSYVRYGPEHTAKFKRTVAAIEKKGGAVNAYAVASARLGKKAFKKTDRALRKER
jgi:hypothetical protein